MRCRRLHPRLLLILNLIICFILFLLFFYFIWHPHAYLSARPKTPVQFMPGEVRTLQCPKYFYKNFNPSDYRNERYVYQDPANESLFPMDCDSIKGRSRFQEGDWYPEEKAYPIAYARTVFMDYRFTEMELASIYTPQNFYCYALDTKSSPLFRKRINALAKCFPNVYLTNREFDMDSDGHNITHSHYECIKLLAKKKWKWKYLLLLQNHDVALKTNQELIEIFKLLNGTNLVQAGFIDTDKYFNKKLDWSFKALGLFKNESRNLNPHNGFKPELRFAKSLNEVALSRAMVDYMLNEMDITRLIDQVDTGGYGIDEIFMGSLNANDAIAVPGGFTMHCVDRGHFTNSPMRLSQWILNVCFSGLRRHWSCVFGVEHLYMMSTSEYLFVNKMVPNQDMGAYACWQELLYNRTHLDRGLHRLKPNDYLDLPQARYNEERQMLGDKFDINQFKCSLDNGSTGKLGSYVHLIYLLVVGYFVVST